MSKNKTNNTIQAFWVALGSLFAFGFSLVSSMILSRHLDKTDYGTYRQVLYVYNTLLVVFTLGLPKAYAYFLPRVEDCYAKSLIKKITRIFYILGGIFSLLLFIFSPQIASVLKNPDLELALRIFSPVPFLLLPTMGTEGIFAAYQKNKYTALYNIATKSFILLCVALPVIFWNGTYIEAIVGFVVASFISFLLANCLKYWCVKEKGNQPVDISYKEILHFSLPLLFITLCGIIRASVDKFYISRFFGVDIFAEFVNGSLDLPFVGMIISACSAVLLPLFSRKVHEGVDLRKEILPLWINVFEKTIKLTYPLVLFFLFYSDHIMLILYGAEYSNSGIYFAIKLVIDFFRVISFFPILIAIGAFRFFGKVQLWEAISVIILEYISILICNSPYVVTGVSTLCAVVRITILLSFVAHYFKVGFWTIIPVKLASAIVFPSVIILLIIRLFLDAYLSITYLPIVVTIAFLLYLICYFVWTKIAKIDYKSIIRPVYGKLIK